MNLLLAGCSRLNFSLWIEIEIVTFIWNIRFVKITEKLSLHVKVIDLCPQEASRNIHNS